MTENKISSFGYGLANKGKFANDILLDYDIKVGTKSYDVKINLPVTLEGAEK